MKVLRKSIFILMVILLGVGCFIIAEFFISTTSGDENYDYKILGIEGVENFKTNYFLNEKLSVDDAKLCLQIENDREKLVDIKKSNISNFDSTQIGERELEITYEKFTIKIPYTINYKKMEFDSDNTFDFELNEDVTNNSDFDKIKINLLDVENNVVAQKMMSEMQIFGLDTSKLTKNEPNKSRTATVLFDGLELDFDYTVFYFAEKSNYVGQSEKQDDGCVYEILSFVPNVVSSLKVAQKLDTQNLIVKTYQFDLKRVDLENKSSFLSSKSVASLDFQTKVLTLAKDVVGNSKQVEIQLQKSAPKNVEDSSIKSIVKVDGLQDTYYLGQDIEIEKIVVTVLTNDKKEVEIELGKENISNLTSDAVGNFVAKIKYFDFVYLFGYKVCYKSIEFYFEDGNKSDFVFKVGSRDLFSFHLICFDNDGLPQNIKLVEDEDVRVFGFDTQTSTNGEKRKARIECLGASLEFEYIVE